jgi:hypothetical protein
MVATWSGLDSQAALVPMNVRNRWRGDMKDLGVRTDVTTIAHTQRHRTFGTGARFQA